MRSRSRLRKATILHLVCVLFVLAAATPCAAHQVAQNLFPLGPYPVLMILESWLCALPLLVVLGVHVYLLRAILHPAGYLGDCWHAATALILSKCAESLFVFVASGGHLLLAGDPLSGIIVTGLVFGVGLAANFLAIRFWYRRSPVTEKRVFQAAAALSASSYVLLMVSAGIWVGMGII